MTDPTPPRRRWLPFACAAAFAVAHTQPPGFYSNQNQYYLHGLAAAGYGDLATDWLANTADPTLLFSAGVAVAHRLAGVWPLGAAFFLLLAGYFLALWAAVAALPWFPRTAAGRLGFAAALTVVHAGIVRAASTAWFGVDYPWYLQAGVANQYVLGPGLQPSAFGVVLLAALAAAAWGRPVLAGLLAAGTCWFHATYLLPAGLLVFGMMLAEWRAGRRRSVVVAGGVSLLAVVPVVLWVNATFADGPAEQTGSAQAVLAWVRIPHHTDIRQWLDPVAVAQLAWAAGGLVAFHRTRLFLPLLALAGGGLLLTVVQVQTGDAALALVFPWRVTVLLVPLATAAAAAGVGRLLESRLSPVAVGGVSLLAVAAAVAGSGFVYAYQLGYRESEAEAELLRAAAGFRRPGDVYLLPARFPGPPTAKGSASSTFVLKPPTDRPNVFELQRFRLGTGAAAYIDFKSIPYRADEVHEWHRRVSQAEAWYAAPDWDASGAADAAAREGVTHVVAPAGTDVRSRRLEPVWEGTAYRVYRLRPAQ